MMLHPYLNDLVNLLVSINGVGHKVATKIALNLASNSNQITDRLLRSLSRIQNSIGICQICGNLVFNSKNQCNICSDPKRTINMILIVESISDLMLFESLGQYSGVYHVLNGLISPINGVMPEKLNIGSLLKRLNSLFRESNIQTVEVIFGFSQSIDSDATTMYIKSCILKDTENIKKVYFTRLASGIPAGSDIEHISEKTLAESLNNRVYIP